MANFVMTS